MLRKSIRLFLFLTYATNSIYFAWLLIANAIYDGKYLFGLLILVQVFGFVIGATELYLLKHAPKSETTFGDCEKVSVYCFVQDEVFETIRISLLSLKYLRGSPKVRVFCTSDRSDVRSLCEEFGFEYKCDSFELEEDCDHFLVTNGHTIIYPDAILVGQRRLGPKISYVELNNSNYSSHALGNSEKNRDASRAFLIAWAAGSHSVPIYTGGPVLTQAKNCNLESLHSESNVPSFSTVIATCASSGHKGTITSHPCCECMSHNEVDHNISSRIARVEVSRKLQTHPEYVDTAKGIIRRYISWYYMRFFWIRSLGTILFAAFSLIFVLSPTPTIDRLNILITTFLIAQFTGFLLSKLSGDYRNPLERIHDSVLDGEAFLFYIFGKRNMKKSLGRYQIRLMPFFLSLFVLVTLVRFIFSPSLVVALFTGVGTIALYRAMAVHLSARQRQFARRLVSITGSSSYESMWIVDLTHRGAAYVCDTSFEIGEETPLVFRVPTMNGDSLITVVGKVTYCAPRGSKFQVGVAFKELSQQALDDLTLYCSVLYPYRRARNIDESENVFDNVDFNFPRNTESKKNSLTFAVYSFSLLLMVVILAGTLPMAHAQDVNVKKVDSDVISTSTLSEFVANGDIYKFDSLLDAGSGSEQFTISSSIYIDNNTDGAFNVGDEPLAGIEVALYEPSTNELGENSSKIASTLTDGNGIFEFRFVSGGQYFVRVSGVPLDLSLSKSSKSELGAVETVSGYRSNVFEVGERNNGNILEINIGFERKYDLIVEQQILGLTGSGFIPGDRVSVQVSVTNLGPSTAPGGFEVTSTLGQDYDEGSVLMTDTGGYSPCGFDQSIGQCISNLPLAVGETRSFTFSVISNVPSSADSARRSIISKVTASKTSGIEIGGSSIASNNLSETVLPVAQPSGVGGRVFLDENKNSKLDGGEKGIVGVRIGLLKFNDRNGNGNKDPGETVEVANDITDSKGYYGSATGKSSFQSLDSSSEYGVIFSRLPEGLKPSSLDNSEDDLGQGDKKKPNNSLPWINFSSGQIDVSANYGLLPREANLEKTVFVDLDKNSKKSDEEVVIKGIDVRLFRWVDLNNNSKREESELPDNPIAIGSINENGLVSFNGIQVSHFETQFYIEIDLPQGYQTTSSKKVHRLITKFENAEDFNRNPMRIIEAGSNVIGQVWLDLNNNALFEEKEFSPSGIVFELVNTAGKTIASATTNREGEYSFSRVPSGTYLLGMKTNSIPKGFLVGGIGFEKIRKDLSGKKSLDVQVQTNKSLVIRDLALVPSSSISGFVFDQTENSNLSNNQNVLSGSGVNLVSGGQFIGATQTDCSGQYKLKDLVPGRYVIEVENDLFKSSQSYFLVPGQSRGDLGKSETAKNSNINKIFSGQISEVELDKKEVRDLENLVLIVLWLSGLAIVAVLARRKKLIYRVRS